MFLRVLPVGPLEANCYLSGGAESSGCLVIDPGGEAEVVRAAVAASGRLPEAIFLTHGHLDHIGAAVELREAFSVSLIMHPADRGLSCNPDDMVSFFGLDSPAGLNPDRLVEDGDRLEAGGLVFEVLHTPGHSPGGVCLLLSGRGEAGRVFTGDTLFAAGVGRADLPGGDERQLADSIRSKLFTLPDETIIHPGHGPSSTIGREKANLAGCL